MDLTIKDFQGDMKNYMKEKNKIGILVVKDIINTATNKAIEDKRKEVTLNDIAFALSKLKKVYQEQIDTCPANREDKMIQYKEQFEVLSKYLPTEVSKDEIRNIVKDLLKDKDINNAGKAMQFVMPLLKSLSTKENKFVEGKVVMEVIKEIIGD